MLSYIYLDKLRFLWYIIAYDIVIILYLYIVDKALIICYNIYNSRGLDLFLNLPSKLFPNILRITLLNKSIFNGLSSMLIIELKK